LIGVDRWVGLILLAWRGPSDLERRRVRCVFSECLNDNTLGGSTGAPPGGPPGMDSRGRLGWCAAARVMRRPVSAGGMWAQTAMGDLVCTVFPADCRSCGVPLVGAESGVSLCDGCLSRIQGQSEPAGAMALCGCCGEALAMEGLGFAGARVPAEGLLCPECRTVTPELARAVAYGWYEDELHGTVHLLKYERMPGRWGGVAGAVGDGGVVSW
jgi:hypothetical protein